MLKLLTWPQIARNPISENCHFKNFLGEDAPRSPIGDHLRHLVSHVGNFPKKITATAAAYDYVAHASVAVKTRPMSLKDIHCMMCVIMSPVPSLSHLPGPVPVQGNWKSTQPCPYQCKYDGTLEICFRCSIRPVKKISLINCFENQVCTK